ncbi:MAG TPA: hypothetical protein VF313_09650, partial [Anaerolineaceae bacterium]
MFKKGRIWEYALALVGLGLLVAFGVFLYNNDIVLAGVAGVVAAAAPVIFAVVGETITERAGVINLSVNGTILLSAMAGFAVSLATDSVFLGFVAGGLVGGLVATIVAFSSISLKQSQV